MTGGSGVAQRTVRHPGHKGCGVPRSRTRDVFGASVGLGPQGPVRFGTPRVHPASFEFPGCEARRGTGRPRCSRSRLLCPWACRRRLRPIGPVGRAAGSVGAARLGDGRLRRGGPSVEARPFLCRLLRRLRPRCRCRITSPAMSSRSRQPEASDLRGRRRRRALVLSGGRCGWPFVACPAAERAAAPDAALPGSSRLWWRVFQCCCCGRGWGGVVRVAPAQVEFP